MAMAEGCVGDEDFFQFVASRLGLALRRSLTIVGYDDELQLCSAYG